MELGGLERRIVQMLTCDPNRGFLEKLLKKQRKIDFRYVASEFPIITDEGYGFLDLVGKDESQNLIILVECKPNQALLEKALKEVTYYEKSLNSYGLFQIEGLTGLYHTAILGEHFNANTTYSVEHLILDESHITRQTGLSYAQLFSRYREFMINWIARKHNISSHVLQRATPEETAPVYLINRLKIDQRKSHIAYVGLHKPLGFVELDVLAVNAPLTLDRDKTNYETMRRIEDVKNSGRFSIQFHTYGHSRPMLFFEVNDQYSACFIHTGRHELRLNGYYESSKVLKGTKGLYGLVEVEFGRYSAKESKRNRVTLEVQGRRCHGELKLNFLDRIYIDDLLTVTLSKQTELENH